VNKPTKKSSSLLIISLLAFCWGAYFLGSLVLTSPKEDNLNFIPKNTTATAIVDARKLVGETSFSLLFENENSELLTRIRSGSEDFKNKKTILSLGVNSLSKVVLFTTASTGRDSAYLGLIFNITQTSLWDRNLSEVLTNKQVGYRVGNVGIILTCNLGSRLSSKGKQLDILPNKTKMLSYVKFIFSTSANTISNRRKFKKKTIVKITHNFANGPITSASYDLDLNRNTIELVGNIILSNTYQEDNTMAHYSLGKRGIQIGTSLTTKSINDTLQSYLTHIGFNVPFINSFSMNYVGLSLEKNTSRMIGIPRMDLLLEFKDTCSIQDLAMNIKLQDGLKVKISNNQIDFGKLKYHLKQIDVRTIYIGEDPNPKIITNKKDVLLHIQGDLKMLTKVQGKGLIIALIENFPQFKAGKTLFESTETIDMHITRVTKEEALLKCSILFSKNKNILIESINFLLLSNSN
jgi:hypothetical protein